MNRKYIPLAVIAGIILIGIVAWAFANKMQPLQDVSTLTYKNDAYGFEIKYPKDLTTETSFRLYYALSDNWRSQTLEEEQGMALVAIPVFRVDNQGDGVATGKPYPLYFTAEVRVGASSDSKAVAGCLKTDPGYADQKHETVKINGTDFERFEFADAAMMQYVQGVSYRAVHDGMCFAIEQLKAGSSYRDESMSPGIPDSELDAHYALAGEIARTFRFTR